jgi:hypothetical protein
VKRRTAVTAIAVVVAGALAVGAKLGYTQWRVRAEEQQVHLRRMMNIEDAVRDCDRMEGARAGRIPSLVRCGDDLGNEIDRARQEGVFTDAQAAWAHAAAAKDLAALLPPAAAVADLSAKARDERLNDAIRLDRRVGISLAYTLGAGSVLAASVSDQDHEIDRNNSMRTLRDHGLVDDLLRVAMIDKQQSQVSSELQAFRGSVQCLLGEPKAGMNTMGDFTGTNGVIAARACGAAPKVRTLSKLPSPEPDAETLVPAAMSLLPPLEKSTMPALAMSALFANAVVDPSVKAPAPGGMELLPLTLGPHPTLEEGAAWAAKLPVSTCPLPQNRSLRVESDPWSLTLSRECELLAAPPAFIDVDAADAAATTLVGLSGTKPGTSGPPACARDAACCDERAVWFLARELYVTAAVEAAREGHRSRTRELLVRLEALDPSVQDSSVWLAIDAYPEAKARAEKAIAELPPAPASRVRERLDLALAELGLHDLPAAFADAERARSERIALTPVGAGDKHAPSDAMEALWLMTALGIATNRPPPPMLVRYETAPEHRLRFEDPVREDSEELALQVWRAGIGTDQDRLEERMAIWSRRELDVRDGPYCVRWMAYAELARGGDPEPWLDAFDSTLEHKNFGNWRGSAISRARCRAAVLSLMGSPAAKEWSLRADRLGATIKDPRTAMLAYYVGL